MAETAQTHFETGVGGECLRHPCTTIPLGWSGTHWFGSQQLERNSSLIRALAVPLRTLGLLLGLYHVGSISHGYLRMTLGCK